MRPLVTRTYSSTLAVSTSKVISYPVKVSINSLTEYDFILAEQFLLLASTKESASTLAKLYIQWQLSKNQYDVDIGRFALRGVLG